jgi:hypothetical protein
MKRDVDLFDEQRLRRALRLDETELPPRMDVAAIVARARVERPSFAAASLVSTFLAGVAAAGLVGLIAVAFPAVAPSVASDVWAATLEGFTHLAVPASAVLAVAEQPTVPVAAIAALAVAIAYEYAQRRELVREVTS